MEKIRLKNGTEFQSVPMGIDTKGNTRVLKIITDMSHDDILSEFTNNENISQIKYVLADETIGATYEDCAGFKSLTFIPSVQIDDNTVSNIWMVLLSTDAVERAYQRLSNEVLDITTLIIMMSMPTMM